MLRKLYKFENFDKFVSKLTECFSCICLFDYIDIFTTDFEGVKNLEKRLCGEKVPPAFISVHQIVELTFKSDYTGSRKGFYATYEFIDEKWQSFPPSTLGCGTELLNEPGGEIMSPGFPGLPLPNTQCTWTIRTDANKRIVLYFRQFILGFSETCSHTYLALYNGFTSPTHSPDVTLCRTEEVSEFVSKTFRVTVRFRSGTEQEMSELLQDLNPDDSFGFHISWTSFWVPGEGEICDEFHCKGGEYCIDTSGLLCNPLPRYCISRSLKCNGSPNCGPYDPSDEQMCYRRTVIQICISIVSFLCATLIIATSVFMYRYLKVHPEPSYGILSRIQTLYSPGKFNNRKNATKNEEIISVRCDNDDLANENHLIRHLERSPSVERQHRILEKQDVNLENFDQKNRIKQNRYFGCFDDNKQNYSNGVKNSSRGQDYNSKDPLIMVLKDLPSKRPVNLDAPNEFDSKDFTENVYENEPGKSIFVRQLDNVGLESEESLSSIRFIPSKKSSSRFLKDGNKSRQNQIDGNMISALSSSLDIKQDITFSDGICSEVNRISEKAYRTIPAKRKRKQRRISSKQTSVNVIDNEHNMTEVNKYCVREDEGEFRNTVDSQTLNREVEGNSCSSLTFISRGSCMDDNYNPSYGNAEDQILFNSSAV